MNRRGAGRRGAVPARVRRRHRRCEEGMLRAIGVLRATGKRRVVRRWDLDGRGALEPPQDRERCSCGCDRIIRRRLSLLLQEFFASKRRWLSVLRVERWRPAELERVSVSIQKNGYNTLASEDLDLDTIQLDVSRQQWLGDAGDANLVQQALLAFCVVNNVGYWQGLHDVAAALVHLEPKPRIGELAALVEKLVCRFASILMRTTDENIVNDAGKMAAKWRLIFLFFFPKVATELERLADSNSWNINWFLTLGFYRFGCAFLALEYAYAAIVSSAGCMTAFMYHELGYLGVRGHMRWLLENAEEHGGVADNLFPDEIGEEALSQAVTNSNMVHLTSEELINVSRNLYDTLNDVENEMADFPIIAILKMSNYFYNRSPLSLYKSNDLIPKNVVKIGVGDIFKGQDTQRSLESQSRQSQVIARGAARRVGRAKPGRAVSDVMNEALLDLCLQNLRSNVLKKSFIFPSRFAGAIGQTGRFRYNVVDVRSSYLKYGEALETFFGDTGINYLTEEDVEAIKGDCCGGKFTVWVIVTDDGFDNAEDSTSLESLDRGMAMYWTLSAVFTGVAVLKGGYKGLLRWKNLPVPGKSSMPFFKRIMEWLPIGRDQGPKIAIQSFVTAIDDTIFDISGKIRSGVASKMSIFRKRRRRSSSKTQEAAEHTGARRLICARHTVHVAAENGVWASFGSNGGIKVNGIIWHPETVARHRGNLAASCILYLASLFQVANVDRILEVVLGEARVVGAREIAKKRMSDFRERLGDRILVVHESECGTRMLLRDRVLRVIVKLVHTCPYTLRRTLVKPWWITLTSRTTVVAPLVAGEMLLRSYLAIVAERDSRIAGLLSDDDGDDGDDGDDLSDVHNDTGREPVKGDGETLVRRLVDISSTAFEVPMLLDRYGNHAGSSTMVERRVAPIDLGLLKSYTSASSSRSVTIDPALCSERRAHVFSRRIKRQTRSEDNTAMSVTNGSKPSNAVNRPKNVFIPRSQLKKAQTAGNQSEQMQPHVSLCNL
ncbi:TBC domain-containing protein [Babesia caballi]|uniref:TBC domain-containing protein n=1 Tax=Babesia caballi TaxID=5871 RepID=A0AAV4LZH9_BABCB|nr:TBC domain-containing protein [Babesia caballi]